MPKGIDMYKHEILNKNILYKKISSISEYVNWMVGISDYLCNSQCGYEYVYEDCFVSISINKFARCTSLDRLGPAPWTLLST